MRRKLVRQGSATLMISLPSSWVKEHGLMKGSEVDVEPTEKQLIISAQETDKVLETEISLDTDVESSIRTLITNAYRKGCDRIIVRYRNEKQFEILSDTIKTRLIGFDVIRKDSHRCVIENITEPSEDHFDNILTKVFLNISSLFDATEKVFNNQRPDENVENIEERIMKYDNFCRRIVSKKRLGKSKAEFFWSYLHLVDHGQRELYHLNKVLKNVQVSESTKELLTGCREMFELSREAYLTMSLEVLAKMHPLEKELIYDKGYKALETGRGRENIVLYHLLASIRKFFQTNSPLSGIIL